MTEYEKKMKAALQRVFVDDNVDRLRLSLPFWQRENNFNLQDNRIIVISIAAKNNAVKCLEFLERFGINFIQSDLHEIVDAKKYQVLEYAAASRLKDHDKDGIYAYEKILVDISKQSSLILAERLSKIAISLIKTVDRDQVREFDLSLLDQQNTSIAHALLIREVLGQAKFEHKFRGANTQSSLKYINAVTDENAGHIFAKFGCLNELMKFNKEFPNHKKNAAGLYPIDYLFKLYKPSLPEKDKAELRLAMFNSALCMRNIRFQTFSLSNLDPNLSNKDILMISCMIFPFISPVFHFDIPKFNDPNNTLWFVNMARFNQSYFNDLIHVLTARFIHTENRIMANVWTPHEVTYIMRACVDMTSNYTPSNPLFGANVRQHTFRSLCYSAAQMSMYYRQQSDSGIDIYAGESPRIAHMTPGGKALMIAKQRADAAYHSIELPSH